MPKGMSSPLMGPRRLKSSFQTKVTVSRGRIVGMKSKVRQPPLKTCARLSSMAMPNERNQTGMTVPKT